MVKRVIYPPMWLVFGVCARYLRVTSFTRALVLPAWPASWSAARF